MHAIILGRVFSTLKHNFLEGTDIKIIKNVSERNCRQGNGLFLALDPVGIPVNELVDCSISNNALWALGKVISKAEINEIAGSGNKKNSGYFMVQEMDVRGNLLENLITSKDLIGIEKDDVVMTVKGFSNDGRKRPNENNRGCFIVAKIDFLMFDDNRILFN